MNMIILMTVINAPMEDTVHNKTTLLVAIVPQVNTCQVAPPAIMRAHQTVKYVNVVNTQIKMAAVIVHGVVRDNTSLTMRVPKVNMIILMTVINAPMEGTVHNNIILLLVSPVTQVNTCQVMSPAIMRANQIVKYVSTVDIALKDMGLAPCVMREDSSMIMQ